MRIASRATVAGLIALCLSTASLAGDPFDEARYNIGTKANAQATALIDSGQFDVNMQTDEGYSLLHYAADAGNLEMVKALIARGADPTLKSQIGSTAYDMAIGTLVKAEIRKAMTALAAGNSPALRSSAPSVTRNAPKTQIARVAGTNGMCERARTDPASSSRSAAMRPFLAAKDAVWYNHPDELTGLLEDCVSINDTDEYGWTLLHHAAQRDRLALAKILLAFGARSGPRNKDGQTAAHLATSAEMKALLGTDTSVAKAANSADQRKLECRQKFDADAALASDTTGRMSAMRRWEKCLKTGLYW
jgi:ankyrin repeat protein